MPAGKASRTVIADLLRQGMLYHQEGRLTDAERLYRDVLRHEPANPQGLHLLGALEGQRGRFDAALALLRRAAARAPKDAHIQNNLGETLRQLGRYDEAFKAFRRAVEIDPAHWTAWTSAGEAAKAEIARAEAGGDASEARRLRTFAAEWLCTLGQRYLDQGLGSSAETAFREAVAVDPGNAAAHRELGPLLRMLGRLTEAEAMLRRAIDLQPESAEAHHNLGAVLGDRGAYEAAEAAYEKALQIQPGLKKTSDNLAATRLFGLIFRQDVSPQTIFEAHRDWGCRYMADLARDGRGTPPIFPNAREPERRLRVGYLSPDMRQHSVSYFFEPLLAAHDRAAVETYCYADVRRPDETTSRLRELAMHWRSVTGMDDATVQRQIAADRIDILVELAGHTGDTRLTVLAPKPAPVTVSWLGYPATTGLPTVDYRLTDSEADPPGEPDRWHTEELVRLPRGFLCYRPAPDAPIVADAPVLTRGFVTFGSFNNPRKISRRCVEVWAEILTAVPTARLFIKGVGLGDQQSRKRFEDLFAEHGVSPDRIDIRGVMASTTSHLDAYREIDLGLDPFPYNGTTTTCEALWMGVPVLTLRGDRHAARVGASLLTRIGLEDLIAENPEDYVAKAAALAADSGRLQALRAGMRERMRHSPLMDERGFARQFETALRDMWRRWCRSSE